MSTSNPSCSKACKHCCNSHHDLLAALEAAEKWFQGDRTAKPFEFHSTEKDVVWKIQDAIAKTTKGGR